MEEDRVDVEESEETGGGGVAYGVRYITEDLIKRVAKEDSLHLITELNLTLNKEGGKKIKFIENLEKLRHLTSLNLSCNMVEKIERLDKLTNLQRLNLSFNCITRLDGLESLTGLLVLNVTGNRITTIPTWLPKKLKALQVVRLGQNKIESLHELCKLRPLTDLAQLSVDGSPVCRLAHYRSFLAFYLRTVQILDGESIRADEREEADERFAQEEVGRLTHIVDEREREVHDLSDRLTKFERDSKVRDDREKELHRKQKQNIRRMEELERELTAKDELLRTKSEELTRACLKHYELEQQLAFHKIDHKFDTLGRPPQMHATASDEEDEGDISGTGESPYIGRGSYARVQSAPLRSFRPGGAGHHLEQVSPLHTVSMVGGAGAVGAFVAASAVAMEHGSPSPFLIAASGVRPTGIGATDWSEGGSPLTRPQELEEIKSVQEAKLRLAQALDSQLQDKHEAISRAQQRLEQLQEELRSTEDRVFQASLELNRLVNASPLLAQTEAERGELRQRLSGKVASVQKMRGEADELKRQMEVTQGEVSRQQTDVDALRYQLSRLGTDIQEPFFLQMQREMVDKEAQVAENSRLYEALEAKLDNVVLAMKREAEEIRDLERRLRAGQVEQNDQIKAELETVIEGLQGYLSTTRRQADELRDRAIASDRARLDLERRLADQEAELTEAWRAVDDGRERSRDEVDQLEVCLEEERAENEQLKQRLEEAMEMGADELKVALDTVRRQEASSEPERQAMEQERSEWAERNAMLQEQMNRLDEERRRMQARLLDQRREFTASVDRLQREQAQQLAQFKKRRLSDDHSRGNDENPREEDDDSLQMIGRARNMAESIRLGQALPSPRDPIGQALTELVRTAEAVSTGSRSHPAIDNQVEMRPHSYAPQTVRARSGDRVSGRPHPHHGSPAEDRVDWTSPTGGSPELTNATAPLALATEAAADRSTDDEGDDMHVMSPMAISPTREDGSTQANQLLRILADSKRTYSTEMGKMRGQISRLQDAVEATKRRQLIGRRVPLLGDMCRPPASVGGTRTQGTDPGRHSRSSSRGRLRDAELAAEDGDEEDEERERRHPSRRAPPDSRSPPRRRSSVPRIRDRRPTHSPTSDEDRGPPKRPRSRDSAVAAAAAGGGNPARPRTGSLGLPRVGVAGGYETLSSDEQGMFEELHGELVRLKRQLEVTELNNASRLDEAMDHISGLESELVRRDAEAKETKAQRIRDEERREWEKQLESTHKELQQCQTRAAELERRLAQREGESHRGTSTYDRSNETIGRQQSEMDRMNAILQAQKAEIIRLNNILDRMVGIQPGEAQTAELRQVQHDLHQLSQTLSANQMLGGAAHMGSSYYHPQPDVGGPLYTTSLPANASPVPAALLNHAAATVQTGYNTRYGSIPGEHVVAGGGLTHSTSSPTLFASSGPMMGQATAGTLPGNAYIHQQQPPSAPGFYAAVHPDAVRGGRRSRSALGSSPGGVVLLDEGASASLYCNVPEHHHLEDYLQVLQEKNHTLRRRMKERRQLNTEKEMDTVDRLRDEIEVRKDELTELDVELERRRSGLDRLVEQERALEVERDNISAEVAQLHADRESVIHETHVGGASASAAATTALRSRQQFLQDEVVCIEETLAKRRAELNGTEGRIQEAQAQLQEVKDEARDTIRRYDEARLGYDQVLRECDELERRAKEAGLELAKSTDEMHEIKSEVLDLESNKRELELTLNDIQHVIASKDAEFHLIEQQLRQATDNLARMQCDLSLTSEQEREKLSSIQEGDRVLTERRTELERLRQQIDYERSNLDSMDRSLGERRTELALVEQELTRRREEAGLAIREAGREVAERQREIRELQGTVESLTGERTGLAHALDDLRAERDRLREDLEREQQVVHNLAGAAAKQQLEVKHLTEMARIEQAELAKVTAQHQDCLGQMERAQAALHDLRKEIEEFETQRRKKLCEVDRLRESSFSEQSSIDRLLEERRVLETSIGLLAKERDLLADQHRTLEGKMEALRKQKMQLETTLFNAESRLSKVQSEAEEAANRVDSQRSDLDSVKRQAHTMSQQVKEAAAELKSIRLRIQEQEGVSERSEGEMRDKLRQRDQLNAELHRLQEEVRMCRHSAEQAAERRNAALSELEEVGRGLAETRAQFDDTTQGLSRVRLEYEREEERLNRLVGSTTHDLTAASAELHDKQDELARVTSKLTQLKREMDDCQRTEDRSIELEKIIREQDRIIASSKLAAVCESQNHSNSPDAKLDMGLSTGELAALREELGRERAAHRAALADLESAWASAAEGKREQQRLKRRTRRELDELQRVAEEQCNRANRLGEECNKERSDNLLLRNQIYIFGLFMDDILTLMTQEELAERERRLFRAIRAELDLERVASAAAAVSGGTGADVSEPWAAALADLQGHRAQLVARLEASQTGVDGEPGPGLAGSLNTTGISSSGLGSSITPGAAVTQSIEVVRTEMDAWRRALHDRLSAQRQLMESESRRTEESYRVLKHEMDRLQAEFAGETAAAAAGEGEMGATRGGASLAEGGDSASSGSPQHQTYPRSQHHVLSRRSPAGDSLSPPALHTGIDSLSPSVASSLASLAPAGVRGGTNFTSDRLLCNGSTSGLRPFPSLGGQVGRKLGYHN